MDSLSTVRYNFNRYCIHYEVFKAESIADILILPRSHPGNAHMQGKDITGLLSFDARNEVSMDKASRGKKNQD